MSTLPARIHAVSLIGAPPLNFLVTTEHRLLRRLAERALKDIEVELALFPTPNPMAVMNDERRRYAQDMLTEQRDYTAILDFLKDLER